MRQFALVTGCLLSVWMCGCSSNGPAMDVAEMNTLKIRFPNGFTIRAEMMTRGEDLMKGMRFRPSLAADRGMLFMHGKEGSYQYWMHEVLVPLDMIWMNKDRRVVQLVHKAPPCPGPREKCPSYGGQFPAIYILEVPAGTAAKQGLKPGMQLDF